MIQVSPINFKNTVFKSANYNAVKIQINDPQTNLPEGMRYNEVNNGRYNAVNVEVNRPVVNVIPRTYAYPENKTPVTVEYANIKPVQTAKMPIVPVAYQSNVINDNSQIYYQNEFETENVEQVKEFKTAEKSDNEVIFQANPEDTLLGNDLGGILLNLNSNNYDKQAQQMEEITRIAITTPEKAVGYITTSVFEKLIDITLADTASLEPPTKEQIELRRKIIINELIKEEAKKQNKEIKETDLPYSIKKDDVKNASKLSPMEQAERNKEYSLYTMAVLTKVYVDQTKKETGNVVPLTDLPGVSVMVDTIRYNENPSIQIAAIDSLRYLKRDEYNNELNSIFEIASMDKNKQVSRVALEALNS